MTVLVLADDEEVLRKLPNVPADVLVSCGDLSDGAILFAAERCRCAHILAVKGNHDSSAPFKAPIADLHLHTHTVRGITFGGFCGAWQHKREGNFLFEQWEVDEALETFPRVDVFVAHNSPRMIHDKEDNVHLGFMAFHSYVERTRPQFLLHGHQHLNIESNLGATRVIGTYGHRYVVLPE